MQIWDAKKEGPKWLQNWIWEGLGFRLGRVWGGLGPLLGALGRFLVVFWTFKIELFLSIGPNLAPKGLLDRFWVDLERIWAGFAHVWGRFWENLELFEQVVGRFWKCLA